MESTFQTRRLKAMGLRNVVAHGIEVRRCKNCGEEELVFPHLEEMLRVVAASVAQKSSKLTADEIRFLRKYIGWSGADLARHFGISSETVSRWESGHAPIGGANERLLRVLVHDYKLGTKYPLELLDSIANEDGELRIDIEWRDGKWQTISNRSSLARKAG